ncbi:MAG: hypothetical protein ACD_48C00152G0011 [uncultured bacterium]|nr:MAG: hypothetical protein ACD_48C00152G0011 [uncultured bacterium]
MPKVKTKKIVSKRFKITATGKVMHNVQGARHLRRKKSASCKRRQDKPIALHNNKFIQNITNFLRT